jgi:hypothetical protein
MGHAPDASTEPALRQDGTGREPTSVRTRSYKGAHFATFPESVVEPRIYAGTSARGACAKCGAPWRRTVDDAFTTGWVPSLSDPQAGEAVAPSRALSWARETLNQITGDLES